MFDLTCSIELAILLGLLGVAYAIRVVIAGAASFDRVKRDRGSALFGARAMQMGYWALDPLGRILASFGVTPNAVSVTSLVFGIAAGAAIAMGHFGAAAALAAISTVGDALDGIVARHGKTASDAGEVLDAAVDRYTEFAFLGGLVIHDRDAPWSLALALAAILGSFMVSYATAKAEAMGVVAPRGAMRRPERAMYLTLGAACCPFAVLWVTRGGPEWASEAPMIGATAIVAIVANVSAVRRLVSVARTLRERAKSEPGPVAYATVAMTEAPRLIAKRTEQTNPASGFFSKVGRDRELPPFSRREAAGVKDGSVATFGRHQVGSIVATLVDFGIMSALVSGLAVPATIATAVGAAAGGVTNFALGRRWIFRASGAPAAPQAFRYAIVSLISLALNAGGEYVVHDRLGMQYLLARAVVAIAVSVCWNFPVQRSFVYGEREGRTEEVAAMDLQARAASEPR